MSDLAMEREKRYSKGTWVLFCFVAFFAVVAILDSIFVYMAVSTQTGLVTENPYERGVAFNDVLAKAKAQPALQHKASYDGGVLRWQLLEEDGGALLHAVVRAKIFRPVQDGHDVDVSLVHVGEGVYEAELPLPLKGLWLAKLESSWDNKQFQTTYEFIAQ